MTPSTFRLDVGSKLAEKYLIERVIGQGGMGAVYAARHLLLDETVAIKLLLPHQQQAPAAKERLLREARSTLRIRSEHVTRTLDVGLLDDGMAYIVLEYLEGHDVDAYICERGALPVSEAVDIILQASDALAEAHALGIVHRDIKPSNLFRTQRPNGEWLIKVMDFGISKVLADSSSKLTDTNASIGTPCYMAPEQIRNSSLVDARADIWALGVTLFELLTARLPFDGDGAMAMCAAVTSDAATPLRQLRSEAPPELEAVIARCLEKKPGDRYQTVADLAEALLPFAPPSARSLVDGIARTISRQPGKTTIVASSPGRIVAADATTIDASNRTVAELVPAPAPTSTRRTGAFVAAGALLVAGSIAALVMATRPSSAPTSEPSTAAAGAPPTSSPLAVTASAVPTVAPDLPSSSTAVATTSAARLGPADPIAPTRLPAGLPRPKPSAPTAVPATSAPPSDPKSPLRDRE